MSAPLAARTWAVVCTLAVSSAWAQQAETPGENKPRQGQFSQYIASLEAAANRIAHDTVTVLTKDEQARLPRAMRVRIGWAFNDDEANRITGCGDLVNPASIQRESGAVWLCEEGIRTITALAEVLQVAQMRALVHASGRDKAISRQPTAAMLEQFSRQHKALAAPAVRYLIDKHVELVNARLLNRQAAFACPTHVIAYLAAQAPPGAATVECSSGSLTVETNRSAAAWYGKILGEYALASMAMLGIDTTEMRAKINAKEVTPDELHKVSAEVREQVLAYLIRHELGHLTQPPAASPHNGADATTQAEIQADLFAFDTRFEALELKPTIALALFVFWHQLMPYSHQASKAIVITQARGRSIEQLMCDGKHAVLSSSDPALASQIKELQRLSCVAPSGHADNQSTR